MIPNRVFRFWVNDETPVPDIEPIVGAENIVVTRNTCEIPNDYAKRLFDAGDKKFGDYMKFYYLHKYGGIYIDCDVIQIKRLDNLLDNRFFVGRQGAEDAENPVFRMICNAVMGSESGNAVPLTIMRRMEAEPGAGLVRYAMGIMGEVLQEHEATIYPQQYFYPYLWTEEMPESLGPDTYLVHLWAGSWVHSADFNALLRGARKLWNGPE